MSLVSAVLAVVSALLNEFPVLFKDFQALLDGHSANPANAGSLAAQVKADTQTEEDSLGKL